MIPLLRSILILLLVGQSAAIIAQSKYWLPRQVGEGLNQEPMFCSQWLELCSYELSDEQIANLGHDFPPVLQFSRLTSAPPEHLGYALEQIEGDLFTQKGLTGKGVKIGIIDGGFLGAREDPSLKHFFANNRVLWYRDFINPAAEDFGGFEGLDDDHGTEVWGLIGGVNTETSVQFGLATDAEMYLARTDHGGYEKRIEEDYLIAALEAMDSMGVRLVNISLGYSTGYNDEAENYRPEDMDGKTSMIARAIDHAYEERDMLVVVAAGNEGGIADWQVVSTPGDAAGALSVGAAKLKVWDKMGYSSIGPIALPYIKPDISVYATSGTSYSAPVITGVAACLMEYRPDWSAREIRSVIERAGHFHPFPNNYLGHGVPTASAIFTLIEGEEPPRPVLLKTRKSTLKIRGDVEGKVVVLYHKEDHRNVITRTFLRPTKDVLKIRKREGAAFTTVLVEKQVTEIQWLD